MISEATRERLAELERLIAGAPVRGRWLVCPHDNPDPDALASAVILTKLLRQRFQQRVTIAYGGLIGRAENREMVRSLKLELSRIRHINHRHYRHYALVDCQPWTGNSQLPPGVVPDLVIDHHPLRPRTLESPIADVRTRYGATATIVAEYLLAAEVPVTHREATAVAYALQSETLFFSRELPAADREVYEHYLAHADRRLLGRIQNPRLPLSYFRILHDALEGLEGVDSLVISHLRDIDQPDIVPEIADLLLRLEGKTWALCTGVHDERLYCSIRTTNPRADAAGVMHRLLGRRGRGGGHGRIAGGWLPLADPARRQSVQAELGRRLARQLRKNPERITAMALRTPTPPPPTPPPPAAPVPEPAAPAPVTAPGASAES